MQFIQVTTIQKSGNDKKKTQKSFPKYNTQHSNIILTKIIINSFNYALHLWSSFTKVMWTYSLKDYWVISKYSWIRRFISFSHLYLTRQGSQGSFQTNTEESKECGSNSCPSKFKKICPSKVEIWITILKNGWYISSFHYTQTHTLIHWAAGEAAPQLRNKTFQTLAWDGDLGCSIPKGNISLRRLHM